MLLAGAGFPRPLNFALFLTVLVATGCHRRPADPPAPAGPKPPLLRYADSRPLQAGVPPLFEECAQKLGVTYKMGHNGRTPLTVLDVMGPGCAICDFDGDGHADILIVGQAGPVAHGRCALYRNNGDGTFTDVTAGSGLEEPGNYMGCAVADIDNDGKPDILITGYGVVKLFRNLGGFKFQDITKGSGLESPTPTTWASSAAFADVDHDGLVDVYIGRYVVFDTKNSKIPQLCNYAPYQASCGPIFYDPQVGSLYKNLGHGKFKDVTQAMGLGDAHGKTLGVVFADVNGDGWPDLYLGNDEMPGDLYINEGGKRFRNVGVTSGIALSGAGKTQGAMGVDFGDYDRDGRPDLFVSTFEFESKSLYHNDGNLLFSNVSEQTGLSPATWNMVGFGTKFIDVTNNGWLDIAIANGHIHDNQELIDKLGAYRQPMQLFMNQMGRSFADKTQAAGPGFTTPGVGRGLAIGDLNDDGLQDIVITDIEGNVRVLMNRCNEKNNWLRIKLVGKDCNRMGIGALVTVTAGADRWVAEATTGGSYFSASDPRVHFGLGKLAHVGSVEVTWPCGKKTRLMNPHVPGDLTITEP